MSRIAKFSLQPNAICGSH
jgi:hypothetical protein